MTIEVPPLSPTSEAEIDSLRQAVSQKTQPRLLSLKKCLRYLSILLVIVSIALLAFVVRQQHHQVSGISVIDAKWIIPAFAG
ncbi:hypothetical protein GPY51_22090 [Photorhabdus laumondii subsp. laumondii]|uniref:Photorhabdus luminescens subsp. laumondii TTO1 complete genome segment 4/17 n=2 Tax=Photorhabdus laumondii subsp. laumondii TaxID=141679 RepID=Q7N7P8_PHOLL|nr:MULTISPECIES: hypothetical protein [Photorhabdus]AWK40973.1 hypothetical protein A4R40_05280 [Photorhabdus laumondii subsp. laumondii]AXG41775.1 hypothetical protein PluDJC_05420 [Photorhabdus laumondii subsp. laumondii]AXG46308.1 hypothetical protein PluTT01m_05450 [Photorhabdus laumondii subsp. laumondii]MCC8385442.1 hypothetical protein [Photorhabdus laumondii]MCC8388388.1 hypothetical protein [Photorhabdus laumondii]